MSVEIFVIIHSFLHLPNNNAGMSVRQSRECQNVSLIIEGLFAHHKRVESLLRSAEFSSRFIRNLFFLLCARTLLSVHVRIYQLRLLTMPAQYVFDFMPKNEPKV